MKKVIHTNLAGGATSRIAHCYDCDWVYEENDPKVNAECRKHVRATGHTVCLEKTVITYYILEEK